MGGVYTFVTEKKCVKSPNLIDLYISIFLLSSMSERERDRKTEGDREKSRVIERERG